MANDRRRLVEIQSAPVGAPEATFQTLFLVAAALLLVMPFMTTFNELLTRLVINLRLEGLLTAWIVPLQVRMIALLLQPLGIQALVSEGALFLPKEGSAFPLSVYISWNCVGWQSFIVLLITLAAGLQGPYSRSSRLQALALGLLGTFWVNLLRMTLVALVAYHFGRLPAVIFHDYGGALMTLAWLAVFWAALFRYFLQEDFQWAPNPS